MLAINDLINIKHIPAEEELSLKLLIDFYENYLCKRLYKFTLDDGKEVKITFKGASEIYHISGIKHLYNDRFMDGTRFSQEARDGKIDFSTLRKINPNAFNDYSERIRSFACIDTILKNCEYLWFPEGRIEDTKIKVRYLLLKAIEEYNLHMGIDTYNNGKIFYPKTLLVTKGLQKNKFIDKASIKSKVSRLEIRIKATDEIEEVIDREKAYDIAKSYIQNKIDEWLRTKFIANLEAHNFSKEVHPLLLKDNDKIYNLNEAIQFVCENISNSQKKEWISSLNNYIRSISDLLMNVVFKYDPYWTNKIVSETIRGFSNNDLKSLIMKTIKEYIEEKYKTTIIQDI